MAIPPNWYHNLFHKWLFWWKFWLLTFATSGSFVLHGVQYQLFIYSDYWLQSVESLASPKQTLICSDVCLFVCFSQFMWHPFPKPTKLADTMQVVDDDANGWWSWYGRWQMCNVWSDTVGCHAEPILEIEYIESFCVKGMLKKPLYNHEIHWLLLIDQRRYWLQDWRLLGC